MLVTIKQIKMGMASYLKKEIVPKMPAEGFAGFGVSFIGVLAVGYIDRFLVNVAKNPMFAMFELIDADGRIELDNLAEALAFAIPETGLSIPIGKGEKITFRADDAAKLCEYIAK